MAGGAVLFVVTEHPTHLGEDRRRRYEGVRAALEALAGAPVASVHYLDAGLPDADAIVLSGSRAPWALHDPDDLDRLGRAVRAADRPVLGICAGMQLLATFAGGSVQPMSASGRVPERGYLPLEVLDDRDLLRGLPRRATVFQDHEDEVTVLPAGFEVLARTTGCAIQAIAHRERPWWGTQFHPERWDEKHPDGARVLENFFRLAGLSAPARAARRARAQSPTARGRTPGSPP